MKFVRVDSIFDGVAPLRGRLVRELESGKQVLWLLSGGSNVGLAVEVMNQLDGALTTRLTLMLMDERHVPAGDADSNDHKLADAGFEPKQARWIRVLQEGLTIEETTRLYAREASVAFQKADVIIGLFGMGVNGHIAGIQPGSPAVSSADFAASFDWSDFRRITLTPQALKDISAGYLFAAGSDKLPQLVELRDHNLSIDEQPAQLLKQLPEAYIYNDQIGQNGDNS